jgi:hypothetical protein
MVFGGSVQGRSRRRKGRVAFPPSRPAAVRIVVGDAFGTFVREASMSRPLRVIIISPWISGQHLENESMPRLLKHIRKSGASLFVITREPETPTHASAIEALRLVPRATIAFNPRVHAKLFLAEEAHGRGVAVIGSGNATDSSTTLDEAGVVIRPLRGSGIIRHLALTTVQQLDGRSPRLPRKTSN